MLEIQEKHGIEGYEQLASKSVMLHITEALDSGKAIGYIAYAYEPEQTVVYDYSDGGDLMLCDGLVRSVMLKSVIKGIDKMLFELPNDKKYISLQRLGFINANSRLCENLSGYMNSCGDCKNNKQ